MPGGRGALQCCSDDGTPRTPRELARAGMSGPAAVIFDLDGVLVDSETVWSDARRELVEESGGTWRADAPRAMLGMSSLEWSRYMREELGVPLSAEEISRAVVERLERLYRERLPLLPGAREAVESL